MNQSPANTTVKETFKWLQPGAWREPCIVHVTMVANGRQPLFGSLTHDGKQASVKKTSIGWALIDQQQHMLELCPELKILADKVMPDHHHIVLQVTRKMERSIKEVVRGYMQGCKKEARRLGFNGNLYDAPPYFRVLTHKGQLDAMIEYVYANAERAWQKKQNPNLFHIQRATERCGLHFHSLGNSFLLDWPDRRFVEVSRSADDEQISRRLAETLAAANNGAVTYTAAISKGEKTIARIIRENGYPLVVLLNEGFPDEGSPQERYYKPGGVYFNACAKGKLLLLQPTEESFADESIRMGVEKVLRKKALERGLEYMPLPENSQRYRFLALNEMGRRLGRGPDEIRPKKLND